jgi:repressor LexA
VLTWRQRKILRVIRDSIRTRGYPPSMREIADAVGLVSVNTVSYQLEILERVGYVKRDASRRRAIELHLPRKVPPPRVPGDGRTADAPVLVPVLACVTPDLPMLDERNVEDVWPLPRQVAGDGALFMVRVSGDAMTGAAIAPGDWAVARPAGADDAADGDIVVATLDGHAAVRTLRRNDGHTWLVPHHCGYQPLLADCAVILGVVTAVLRLV